MFLRGINSGIYPKLHFFQLLENFAIIQYPWCTYCQYFPKYTGHLRYLGIKRDRTSKEHYILVKILAITCQTSRTQVLVETGSFFNGLISLEPLQNNERKKDEVKFGSEQVVLQNSHIRLTINHFWAIRPDSHLTISIIA